MSQIVGMEGDVRRGPETSRWATPTAVAICYLAIAAGWIVASDLAAAAMNDELAESVLVQTIKGLGFVTTTAAGLWFLLRAWRRQEETYIRALRTSESRFRMMSNSVPVMLWLTGPDHGCTFINAPWLRFTGRRLEQEMGVGWSESVHPEDRQATLAKFTESATNHQRVDLEYRLRKADGTYRWVMARGEPRYDEAGKFAGHAGCCVDISDRKHWEQRIELLLSELDHRVKNNLASVLSLAQQTLERARTLAEFQQVFLGRVEAMARAHSMLAARRWEGIDLRDAAHATLDQFDTPRGRIVIRGDSTVLPAGTAQTVALTLHELGTNAVKYGALSTPGGTVTLEWRRGGEPADNGLVIDWTERGGPPVSPPKERGFGLRFIEAVLRHELRGHAVFRFEREGLRCTLECPMPIVTPLAPRELEDLRPRRNTA